jgi:hypothetical protein
MILTKIIGKVFKVFFEICLWINLIVFPIVGGIGANYVYINTGLGVFLGLIVGIILCVFIGGFTIKLLHLDD